MQSILVSKKKQAGKKKSMFTVARMFVLKVMSY